MSNETDKITCPECGGCGEVLSSYGHHRYCTTCGQDGEVTPQMASLYYREQAEEALDALNDRHLLEVAQKVDGIEPRASLVVHAQRKEVENE
jgi:RecJ-like exonuclease